MLEYVIGIVNVLVVLIVGFLVMFKLNTTIEQITRDLQSSQKQTQENLNHVASAIVGLSELLEEADNVIENISAVPTVGDILQQALQGFIASKLTPMLPEPLQGVPEQFIKANPVSPSQWQDVGEQKQNEPQDISEHST
jgi:hypothetical protein